KEKKLTQAFIQLLIINTVLPLKFCYAAQTGKDVNDEIVHIIKNLAPEDNSIVNAYKMLSVNAPSAMESQALLQLYRHYCNRGQCLRCAIGNCLIRTSSRGG
ncbi:MAG: DUF2851 family protein, partial [Sinomicrobium sp.]|nr:DUF2851 family protein [Sinomicrobium sp.]